MMRISADVAVSIALTIGLGVGANLAAFGLLREGFPGPFPFVIPEELSVVESTCPFLCGPRFLRCQAAQVRDREPEVAKWEEVPGWLDGRPGSVM